VRHDWHRWHYFTYDSLNRIVTAKTAATNQPAYQGDNSIAACWGEQFAYDPWGNLLSISGVSSAYTGCTQESLSIAVNAKNQIIGSTYDSAGNLIIAQPSNVQYTYDAENHLISAAGQTYLYDGDGKRVEKAATGPPLTANKLYWYDQGGNAIYETNAAGNELYRYFRFGGLLVAREEWNDWVDHYGVDALGNVRWLYATNGGSPYTVVWDISDYYPFGGERVVQSNSTNTRKFTGKERDAESGLDMFGARYYGSSLGRFMTPDWAAKPITVPYANFGNPQSLNLYSYVVNNPLTLIDEDGHEIIYAAGLQNAQIVKDSVQAILADPHTSGNLSGYVGPNNPNLIFQSGDLSNEDTVTRNPDGTVTTTTVQGATVPDIQTGTFTSNGVTSAPETQLNSTTITIDNRTGKGDIPGVMVHESVHAGEAKADPAKFVKDAAAEKKAFPNDHDKRPQEIRANDARKAFEKEIKKAVKQIEKGRKKENQ